jgi:hypothetical protein
MSYFLDKAKGTCLKKTSRIRNKAKIVESNVDGKLRTYSEEHSVDTSQSANELGQKEMSKSKKKEASKKNVSGNLNNHGTQTKADMKNNTNSTNHNETKISSQPSRLEHGKNKTLNSSSNKSIVLNNSTTNNSTKKQDEFLFFKSFFFSTLIITLSLLLYCILKSCNPLKNSKKLINSLKQERPNLFKNAHKKQAKLPNNPNNSQEPNVSTPFDESAQLKESTQSPAILSSARTVTSKPENFENMATMEQSPINPIADAITYF